jgi:Protein kinase domain
MKNENIQLDCPKVQQLQRYLSGESSGPGFTALDEHIASCPSCQRKLESLDQNSDFITNMIADVNQRPPVDLGVGLQKSLEQIRNTQSQPIRAGVKPPVTASITMIRDYRILESIGEGGMGCVYRAVHTRLNRPVAIKILRQDRVNSEEAISRFSREMLLVAKLEHPNIVRALDAGDQDGMQFLVMEFLAGVDVGQLSKRLGPLPVSDTCKIIRLATSRRQAIEYAENSRWRFKTFGSWLSTVL